MRAKIDQTKYNTEQHFTGYALVKLMLHTCAPISSSTIVLTGWAAISSATPPIAAASPTGNTSDELVFFCIQTGFNKLMQHE
jgi:hypothetical protein